MAFVVQCLVLRIYIYEAFFSCIMKYVSNFMIKNLRVMGFSLRERPDGVGFSVDSSK